MESNNIKNLIETEQESIKIQNLNNNHSNIVNSLVRNMTHERKNFFKQIDECNAKLENQERRFADKISKNEREHNNAIENIKKEHEITLARLTEEHNKETAQIISTCDLRLREIENINLILGSEANRYAEKSKFIEDEMKRTKARNC